MAPLKSASVMPTTSTVTGLLRGESPLKINLDNDPLSRVPGVPQMAKYEHVDKRKVGEKMRYASDANLPFREHLGVVLGS